MSKLTNKVQQCGMCNYCGDKSVTSISYMEAKAAIEVVKAECIEAVTACDYAGGRWVGERGISLVDAIQAIRNIE